METTNGGLVTTYEKWNECEWRRTWVTTYEDGGWIIGMAGEWYVIWLDRKNDKPVLASEEELAW